MSDIEPYAAVGYALELLARSALHRKFATHAYLAVEILPPLSRRQVRFYLTGEGAPVAMVTWARLDDAVEAEILDTGRALRAHEWNCGKRLFINDFVAPYGTARHIARDLEKHVFPGESASGIRRHADGTVRRIKRQVGNIRLKRL